MTLRAWKNLRTLSCGIFCRKLSFQSSFKQPQFTNLKRMVNFSIACSWIWCTSQRKCQGSHFFRCIDERCLCDRRFFYSSTGKEYSSLLVSLVLFQNQLTDYLLIVKTWMCALRQTDDSLLWSAPDAKLFLLQWFFLFIYLFLISVVHIKLLANHKGEILFLN